MSEAGPPTCYVIHVARHGDIYELRIPELLLAVRSSSLQEGHERLRRRQQEMVDLARSMGALDELPSPAKPPAVTSVFR
jgi:hypothetical protein